MAVLSGGDKLTAALREISRSVRRGGVLKVGFLSNSRYPDGTPTAMVAAIQEFGAPAANIPPRPFFRNAIARHSEEWPAEIATQLKSSDYDAGIAMRRVGALIKGQIQQSIRDGPFEPLKPATITRKGFSTPLIDTGHMLASVAYEWDEK